MSFLFCLSFLLKSTSSSLKVDVCAAVSGVGIPSSVGKKLCTMCWTEREGGKREEHSAWGSSQSQLFCTLLIRASCGQTTVLPQSGNKYRQKQWRCKVHCFHCLMMLCRVKCLQMAPYCITNKKSHTHMLEHTQLRSVWLTGYNIQYIYSLSLSLLHPSPPVFLLTRPESRAAAGLVKRHQGWH